MVAVPQRTAPVASRSTQRTAPVVSKPAVGGILGIAAQYAGIMYVYGGTTPAGFDCSGYTQYVFRQAGHQPAAHGRGAAPGDHPGLQPAAR